MHKWLSAACWTLVGAALGAAAQSIALTVWLLTSALALGLVRLTGPIAYLLNSRLHWRRTMLLLGVGLVSGLICAAGAGLGLRIYEGEREAEEQRRREVQNLYQQVSDANARYDRAQEVQRRRLAKFQITSGRIADAIGAGGSLRYELEHARHTAIQGNTLLAFDRAFDTRPYAASVETWRANTARMLDEELPGLHLGGWFSEMEGVRGIGPSGYQLTKVLECINALQLVQRDLRSHVEQLIAE